MRAFVFIAVLVPLVFASGCTRKRATPTANNETAGAKVAPLASMPANSDKRPAKEKDAEPNWVKVTPGGKKDEPVQLPVDGPASSGKQQWNVGPPQGGFVQQPPAAGVIQPSPSPAPNNQPTAVPPVPAARVEVADMKEVWIFIENASLASGKMPAAATTYAALATAAPATAALVKNEAIVLTGARSRESVWAFEANAYLNGGLIATQNGVERVTAAELKQRLGK